MQLAFMSEQGNFHKMVLLCCIGTMKNGYLHKKHSMDILLHVN